MLSSREKTSTGVGDPADPLQPRTPVQLGTKRSTILAMTSTTLASAAGLDTSPSWFGWQAQRLALALHLMETRSTLWPDTLHVATSAAMQIMKQMCCLGDRQERTEDLAGDLVVDPVDPAPA